MDLEHCMHWRGKWQACGWDPSGENDKTVVSICIDLKQFMCLEPTHLVRECIVSV
jgi:hypothetical protein